MHLYFPTDLANREDFDPVSVPESDIPALAWCRFTVRNSSSREIWDIPEASPGDGSRRARG